MAATSARQIVNKGTRKNIGKFPSLKTGRNVWWESLIERDYVHLIEFDWDVIFYREQPLRIYYTLGGKRHWYTPDFLVERRNKKQIVEIKRKEKLADGTYDVLFRIVSRICREQGYEFVVVTDEMVRGGPLLRNIKLLWRYARVSTHPQHQLLCRKFLHEKREASLGECERALTALGVTRSVLYALLYRGVLSTDLHRPVDSRSGVRFAGEATATQQNT